MTSSPPINVALLSYGMSGEVFHAPLLTVHPGFQLTKILERSKNKVKLRYPQITSVRTLDDILLDEKVELVIVNTPHDSHYDLTRKVLEAGKHAVVEKPFVNTVADGKELIALAKSKKRILSVFQNRRWDGDFQTVQRVLNSGMLGRLIECEAHYDRFRPQVDHQTWKEGKGPGAGILYNLGAHMIDQALVLFGRPNVLTAFVGIQRTGGTSDDSYTIRLTYDHHDVWLRSGYIVREPGPRYTLHGEKGSFIKYGLDPQEQALKDGHLPGTVGWGTEGRELWGKIHTETNGLVVEGVVHTEAGNYGGFYDSLARAIREGGEPAVTAEQALMVIEIIEAAMVSSTEGKRVELR